MTAWRGEDSSCVHGASSIAHRREGSSQVKSNNTKTGQSQPPVAASDPPITATRTPDPITIMSASPAKKKMKQEALDAALSVMTDAANPALYDVTIVCTTDDHQAAYWTKRLSEGVDRKSVV